MTVCLHLIEMEQLEMKARVVYFIEIADLRNETN